MSLNPNLQSLIIFILGGARSGKSSFAEQLAKQYDGPVLFLATAEGLDDEMRERIAKHRAERPPHWDTVEAPRDIPGAIRRLESIPRVILLDCLTLWVSNELLADENDLDRRLLCQLDMLCEWVRLQDVVLILISNEVGLGIVPGNALARTFRDLLGRVNARAAHSADQVYWMVAGLPIEIKSRAFQHKE